MAPGDHPATWSKNVRRSQRLEKRRRESRAARSANSEKAHLKTKIILLDSLNNRSYIGPIHYPIPPRPAPSTWKFELETTIFLTVDCGPSLLGPILKLGAPGEVSDVAGRERRGDPETFVRVNRILYSFFRPKRHRI